MNIKVGEAVAELSLINEHQGYTAEFAHQLHQLNRSSPYSPLTTLHRLNEQLSLSFLSGLEGVLSKAGKNLLGSSDTISLFEGNFRILLRIAPFKLDSLTAEQEVYLFLVNERA